MKNKYIYTLIESHQADSKLSTYGFNVYFPGTAKEFTTHINCKDKNLCPCPDTVKDAWKYYIARAYNCEPDDLINYGVGEYELEKEIYMPSDVTRGPIIAVPYEINERLALN